MCHVNTTDQLSARRDREVYPRRHTVNELIKYVPESSAVQDMKSALKWRCYLNRVTRKTPLGRHVSRDMKDKMEPVLQGGGGGGSFQAGGRADASGPSCLTRSRKQDRVASGL